MSDLVNRIRAARPTVLALSRTDTFILKAYLDRYPAPQPWYETEYDAHQRIGSVGEYTDPDDETLWIHLYATLAYSQTELERLASAEPQPALPVAPSPVNSTTPIVAPVSLEHPKKLLTGWHEITSALEMQHSHRDKVKSLNERCEGPIINMGAGTQPMVYCDELIGWWNHLAVRQQDLANQREGDHLSAEAQYSYSRDGTVAPEIGGEVKKRRSDRKST